MVDGRQTVFSKGKDIPKGVSRRLSLYLRRLERLKLAGRNTVSSADLGSALGLRAAQVRKDLAYFGQFGSAGVGYRVEHLIPEIRKILGTDKMWPVGLIGLGNLGAALIKYAGFEQRGFRIDAIFDNDPNVVGSEVRPGLNVEHVDGLARVFEERGLKLAILAVPPSAAQQIADVLVTVGVRGILNFAPLTLAVPASVHISNVDLAVQLEQLSFLLN